jgi:hypothetical protein
MSPIKKVLLSIIVLGATGSLAGFGAWSAFTATAANTGNSFAAGSVAISQHAGATTLYTGSNKGPGAAHAVTKCVRVNYTGTLGADVKLYASSGITNGSAFNLKVERGSGLTTPDNTMSCAGFAASSTAYDGALGSFGTSYDTGLDGKAAAAAWAQNDAVDYRFTISVVDDPTPNAHTTTQSTGAHTITWEARSR